MHTFEVSVSDGAAVAWLHNKGSVKSIKTTDNKATCRGYSQKRMQINFAKNLAVKLSQ